jgi:NADH (or F420H2) dehydrogenase, subunit C
MTFQEIHQRLIAEFGQEVIVGANSEARDPWVEVAPQHIVSVATFLKTDPSLAFNMLCDLTAVDYLETDPKLAPKFPYESHLEVVYHLQSLTFKHRLTVKVKLPRWKDDKEGELPEVPSVSSVWAIADWHEREAYDLMGVRFTGHPNLVRILCVEDWVGHPLRKDYEFPLEYHGIRGR